MHERNVDQPQPRVRDHYYLTRGVGPQSKSWKHQRLARACLASPSRYADRTTRREQYASISIVHVSPRDRPSKSPKGKPHPANGDGRRRDQTCFGWREGSPARACTCRASADVRRRSTLCISTIHVSVLRQNSEKIGESCA